MQVLTTPLRTRGAPPRVRPVPLMVAADPASSSHFWVVLILLLSVCNLPVLAFLNARGMVASSAMVGVAEALAFALCIAVQMRRLPPRTLALALAVFSWIVLTWLVRQRPDVKSLRDLLIPILFLSLGRQVADSAFAERCLRGITALVVVVALFEVLFTDTYGTLFNTFSFYANLGSISESSAMFSGQTLTLNGYRPEGIGRTLLPALLGSHRTSSLFLEPVSLGNFAAIVFAWVLSRDWKDMGRHSLLLGLAALLLIVLSDSRFGMLVVALLLGYRLLPMPAFRWAAPVFPFVLFGAILVVGWFVPVLGDNVLGRIAMSGRALLAFDAPRLMGIDIRLPMYGDMGYAYVLSRFGALLVMGLLLLLFLMPCTGERAQRLRALLVLYCFSSLAISGTSVFALKTAGLMWFLLGALAADPRLKPRRLKRGFS